ncbi:MAG: hypothetical protein FJW46_00650 [Actinobacteria bacterium]|nr:hypothetical protein [Actinomycetota bacterium]
MVTDAKPRSIDRPDIPWQQTVIYEAHLRGLSAQNRKIPERERGTYAAAMMRMIDFSLVSWFTQIVYQ